MSESSPPPSSADALKSATFQFAHLLRPADAGVIKSECRELKTSFESATARLDEAGAMAESIQSGHTAAVQLMPQLLARTRKMEAVFQRIDQTQEYLVKLEEAVAQLEDRMDVAEDVVEAKEDEKAEQQRQASDSFFSSLTTAFSSLKVLRPIVVECVCVCVCVCVCMHTFALTVGVTLQVFVSYPSHAVCICWHL
jgi:hypothetical protein